MSDFHLIAVQRRDEAATLEQVMSAINDVHEGETAFLSQYAAWTPAGSGRAFLALVAAARNRNINIVTTLNLGTGLAEDLPGASDMLRYNALTVFTRHGAVHVPQAKCTIHPREQDSKLDGPGIGVGAYDRLNRVRIDVDGRVLEVLFLIDSDIVMLAQLKTAVLRCDLLVVVGQFPSGSEEVVERLLERVLAAGMVQTAMFVNGFGESTLRVEKVFDAKKQLKRPKPLATPRTLRNCFELYDPEDETVVLLKTIKIPLMKSYWKQHPALGKYPITILF